MNSEGERREVASRHSVKCFTNTALFKLDSPGVDVTTTFISHTKKKKGHEDKGQPRPRSNQR